MWSRPMGGTVAGAVRHPLNASDFSSFLLQAQSSKAQILGLANAGGDFTNAMKAAKEFGINKTMKIAGLLVFINDVHSLGLANTEGLQLADSWYWNQDDADPRVRQALLRQVQAHAPASRPPTTRPP
jgi:branched-chain amino acid transport system substrate-binding protein